MLDKTDFDVSENQVSYLAMSNKIEYQLLSLENARLLDGADVFDNPIDTVQLAALVADSGHEMVFATTGSRVIGMAFGTMLLHPDKHPTFFINEIGVHENMRNRGIGTELTKMLMRTVREKGYQGIWLATETDNVETRALYQKLNARETVVVIYDWEGALDE